MICERGDHYLEVKQKNIGQFLSPGAKYEYLNIPAGTTIIKSKLNRNDPIDI